MTLRDPLARGDRPTFPDDGLARNLALWARYTSLPGARTTAAPHGEPMRNWVYGAGSLDVAEERVAALETLAALCATPQDFPFNSFEIAVRELMEKNP